jgi:hypothetical protein
LDEIEEAKINMFFITFARGVATLGSLDIAHSITCVEVGGKNDVI